MSDPTQQTYAVIAESYHDRTKDAVMDDHIDRFVAWLPAFGPVIDLGCGPGRDTAVLRAKGVQAVGLDLSWEMMQAGRQAGLPGPYVQADMRHLPLPLNLAGVWACASLLHLPRELVPELLSQINRHLAAHGIFYISLKLGEGETWQQTAHGHPLPRFFTFWQPERLDSALHQANFDIVDGWIDDKMHGVSAATWLVRLCQKRND